MKISEIPESYKKLMSVEDRRLLGIETFEEMKKKFEAKTERQLQRQIVQYLRLRGIEVIWHATNRKSTDTKGTPDILFAVLVNGFPAACSWEIKFGNGLLSKAQENMLERMQTRPNVWRVRVIKRFLDAVDELREMGL